MTLAPRNAHSTQPLPLEGSGDPAKKAFSGPCYYPFGMMMPHPQNVSMGDHTFGFNGMEQDEEMKGTGNSYDFGARMYDPRVGRNLSLDPMGQLAYPQVSHYAGMNDNPIVNFDLQGKLIIYFNGYPGISGNDVGEAYWDQDFLRNTSWELNDISALFFDGNGSRSPQERQRMGRYMGGLFARRIKRMLDKQQERNPDAKIHSVAHSMGAAYSHGFMRALRDATDDNGNPLFDDSDFGRNIYIEPYQGDELEPLGFFNRSEQFLGEESGEYLDEDWIDLASPIPGVEAHNVEGAGHSHEDFSDQFEGPGVDFDMPTNRNLELFPELTEGDGGDSGEGSSEGEESSGKKKSRPSFY